MIIDKSNIGNNVFGLITDAKIKLFRYKRASTGRASDISFFLTQPRLCYNFTTKHLFVIVSDVHQYLILQKRHAHKSHDYR